MSSLRFVDAAAPEHFTAMSLIHALGWRTTYRGFVPDDYMANVITDDHWIPYFQEDVETGRCSCLLLYRQETPLACATFGAARVGCIPHSGTVCRPASDSCEGWGEIISFYAHPDEKRKGYGGILMKEVLRRLRADGFHSCFVLVLRENEGARRFYEHQGFNWDGTRTEIVFPDGTICTDLRYVRGLDRLE
jgi:ribosomal protein S18 acetylase RimI-like enzyme